MEIFREESSEPTLAPAELTPEPLEEFGYLEDKVFQWATNANYREIEPDSDLDALQLIAQMYLHREINWPLNVKFNGRFGPETKKLFMKLFEVANIEYDPADFDESTGNITLRVPIMKKIYALDVVQKPEPDAPPEVTLQPPVDTNTVTTVVTTTPQIIGTPITTPQGTSVQATVGDMPFSSAESYLDAEFARQQIEPERIISDSIDQMDVYNQFYTKALQINRNVSMDVVRNIYDTAVKEGIDPKTFFALIAVESTFKKNAVSAAKFKGLGQLKIRALADVYMHPPHNLSESVAFSRAASLYSNNTRIMNPETNLQFSARYFKICQQAIGSDDFSLIVLAYNQGYPKVNELIKKYKTKDPKIIWSHIKMSGDNPKEKLLANIENYTQVFA